MSNRSFKKRNIVFCTLKNCLIDINPNNINSLLVKELPNYKKAKFLSKVLFEWFNGVITHNDQLSIIEKKIFY